MGSEKYLKYLAWAVAGGLSLLILYVVARLGSVWVSVGIGAFVLFLVWFTRSVGRRRQMTGQPSPEHRVVSNDIDRWGGGTSL